MKRFLIAFLNTVCGLFFLSTTYAATTAHTQPFCLRLSKVKLEKSQEKNDEIYFLITSLHPQEKPTVQQIPTTPAAFNKTQLLAIKDIPLWQGKLEEKKAMTLLISTVEKDSPPWDLDDLLGVIKLEISNVDGKPYVSWSSKNSMKMQKPIALEKASQKVYKLHANQAKYTLELHLDNKAC